MAVVALTDAAILVGGSSLTGQSNEVQLAADGEVLDGTTFGSAGWRARRVGMRSCEATVKGFFDAGTPTLPDDAMFAQLGAGVPASFSPAAPAVGGLAYLVHATGGKYQWGAQVGQLLPFEAALSSRGALTRGAYGSAGTKTGSGNSAGVNLGAVPSGSQLVVGLHVVAVTGAAPTLDVVVQSDDGSGFATPVTQVTFAQVGGSGAGTSQYLSAVPAGTETWFRVVHTLGGGSPTFEFYVTFGISPK